MEKCIIKFKAYDNNEITMVCKGVSRIVYHNDVYFMGMSIECERHIICFKNTDLKHLYDAITLADTLLIEPKENLKPIDDFTQRIKKPEASYYMKDLIWEQNVIKISLDGRMSEEIQCKFFVKPLN